MLLIGVVLENDEQKDNNRCVQEFDSDFLGVFCIWKSNVFEVKLVIRGYSDILSSFI